MSAPGIESEFEIVVHIEAIERSTLDTLNVFLAPGPCIATSHDAPQPPTSFFWRLCTCCCSPHHAYVRLSAIERII